MSGSMGAGPKCWPLSAQTPWASCLSMMCSHLGSVISWSTHTKACIVVSHTRCADTCCQMCASATYLLGFTRPSFFGDKIPGSCWESGRLHSVWLAPFLPSLAVSCGYTTRLSFLNEEWYVWRYGHGNKKRGGDFLLLLLISSCCLGHCCGDQCLGLWEYKQNLNQRESSGCTTWQGCQINQGSFYLSGKYISNLF